MHIKSFARATVGAALLLGLALAQPASAQLDVQIDTDYVSDNRNATFCSLGSACSTSYNLGFNITRPDGTTFNNVYLYREGVLGLGAALPTGITAGNLASLGDAFMAPGLDAYAGMHVSVRFAQHGGNLSKSKDLAATPLQVAVFLANIQWFIDDPNRDMDGKPILGGDGNYLGIFQVHILNQGLTPDGFDQNEGKKLYKPTGNRGVQVTYGYGTPNESDRDELGGTGRRPGLGITNQSLIGYRLGALDGSFAQPLESRPSFDLGPGGVPEPGTWALMIGGFGLAGAALRRRRAPALS